MKESQIIKQALKKWYLQPREKVCSCQPYLKKMAEDLAKEGK
jgi:hypothetical protein